MAQVTLYLDDITAARMRAATEAAGLSQSRWLSRVVKAELADEWPAEVRELAGSWNDAPLAEDLRSGESADMPRESL